MTARAMALGGSLRRWRSRYGSREWGLLAVAIVGGAVVGRSIANEQIMFAGAVAGFVLVIALAQATWLPYVGCVALVSTFASTASLPQFPLPGTPTMTDLFLVGAFAAWLLVLARGGEGPSAFPMATQFALCLFLVAVIGGVVVGRANGAGSPLVEARDVAYYATFWLALTALANERGRSLLLHLGAWGAIAVVATQVAQGVIGPSPLLFYDDNPLRELIVCPSGNCPDPWAEGFPRIRPPGLVLVYVAACFAASYLLWGPRRRRRAAAGLLGICVVGMLVSFNRNMLIGLAAGLMLAGLMASRRGRFAAAAAVAVVLAFAAVEIAGSSEFSDNPIAARVLSITAVSELESSDTVALRVTENSQALEALRSSPIEGLGWAVPYGDAEIAFVDGEFRSERQLFIHNQYLGLWLRTGLLGLLAFVAALVLTVANGTRWLRARADTDDAWLGAGVVASVTAIAMSSIVAIYIMHPAWAPVLAGLMAFGTVLQRDLERSRA